MVIFSFIVVFWNMQYIALFLQSDHK